MPEHCLYYESKGTCVVTSYSIKINYNYITIHSMMCCYNCFALFIQHIEHVPKEAYAYPFKSFPPYTNLHIKCSHYFKWINLTLIVLKWCNGHFTKWQTLSAQRVTTKSPPWQPALQTRCAWFNALAIPEQFNQYQSSVFISEHVWKNRFINLYFDRLWHCERHERFWKHLLWPFHILCRSYGWLWAIRGITALFA